MVGLHLSFTSSVPRYWPDHGEAETHGSITVSCIHQR